MRQHIELEIDYNYSQSNVNVQTNRESMCDDAKFRYKCLQLQYIYTEYNKLRCAIGL